MHIGSYSRTLGGPHRPSDDAAPLFGRGDVLEGLLQDLGESREGGGRLVLLFGQAGVGKSTILRAIISAARDLGFQVVVGRAVPRELPEPFALVRELVQAIGSGREANPPLDEKGPSMLPMFLAPIDSRSESATTARGSSTDESEGVREANRLLQHLSSPAERVDAHRSSLFGQLSDFFLERGSRSPLLLAIDDLQFADDSSIEFLRQFVPLLPQSRIVVVAAATPSPEAPTRTAAAIDMLGTLRGATRRTVPPMNEAELGQFVRWLLHGRDPGHDAVMRWYSQTEGNPLFVEHLVRGTTGFGPATSEEGARPAHDLAEALRERIRHLPESEMRVLVYGAVLGHEFDFPTLARACGVEEERVAEGLDRLVRGGILREKGEERYEFVSERARTDVYTQLTETRRRILHRKAAAAIEATSGARGPTIYELARQYFLGHDDAKASAFSQRAAEMAATSFAFETAVVFMERAIEAERRLPHRDLAAELRLLIELGRLHDELGDFRRAEEVLLDAVARARFEPSRETELALALLGLARTRSNLSQFASARTLAQEAYAILKAQGNARGLLAAHRVLGVAAWRTGDLEEAEHHQREAVAIAEKEGSTAERGHAMVDLANTFIVRGPDRVPEALQLYEIAAALFADGLDHSARARVLMNRALLHHNAGRMDAAIADITEAVAAATRSGSRIWIGYCSLNLAQLRAELHDPASARRELDRATSLLDPLGDQLAHQQAVMIDGMILEEERAFDRAQERYGEALRLARELSLGAEVAEMFFRIAHLAAAAGKDAEARKYLRSARDAGLATLRGDLVGEAAALEGRLGTAADARD